MTDEASEETQVGLGKALLRALEEYATEQPGSVEEFLDSAIGRSRSEEIARTLNGFATAEADLVAARKRGQTREGWLAHRLGEDGVRALLPAGTDSLPDPVMVAGQALAVAGRAWSWLDLEQDSPLRRLLENAEIPAPVTRMIDDFFQSDLGSDVERDVTAVMAGAAVKHAGAQVGEASFVQAVASMDLAARVAKVGYQYSTGKIESLDEATSLINDRIASQVAHFAGEVMERGLDMAASTVGGILDGLLGTGGACTVGLRFLASVASEKLRPHVETGVKKVVKWGLDHAVRKLKEVGATIIKKAGAAFTAVFG